MCRNAESQWQLLKLIRARDDNARSLYVGPATNQRAQANENLERNLGCESIDSCHAIIKMCTAYFHISLAHLADFISGAERKAKEKQHMWLVWCVRCAIGLGASKHWMMKKINRSRQKGHVKLNVQDGEKVGRTRKNEVWLNFCKDIFSVPSVRRRLETSKREN